MTMPLAVNFFRVDEVWANADDGTEGENLLLCFCSADPALPLLSKELTVSRALT
jgi:hypothetical protein